MDYQDFYERYQSGNYPQYVPAGRKKKRGVSVLALVILMLASALLGGTAGGYITARTIDRVNEPAAVAEGAPATAGTGTKDEIAGASATETPPALAASGALSKAQVIELAAPSVVGIDAVFPVTNYGFFGPQTYDASGSGSGVIVSEDGYIATCLHVVDGASSVEVILNDDSKHSATVVGSDVRNDLALIKIDSAGLRSATLGDSDMVTVGEDVIAIGNPLGELRGTSTSGIISALNREVAVESNTMTLLQTDAAISPGNSGGGLFNASGALIGLVNAKASSENTEGLGFAIPVNSVRGIISDLMDLGYVRGRAYLGVYTQNVTMQQSFGWGGTFGGSENCVQVSQVIAGSAAEQAGIRVGDLLLAVDGKEISSNSALSSLIGAYNAGDAATITIQRNGETADVSITFGEYTKE